MKKAHIIYMIVMSALALAGCANSSPSQESEKLFSEMYKDCPMNEILHLSLMEPMYDGDKDINLLLESASDTSVIFPSGYNLKLLSFDNDQKKWIEEKNNIQYLPLDAKYIVGKNDPKLEYVDQIVGIAPNVGTKKALRIIVHGKIYENGVETEECTGAFADIVFTP